MLEFSVKLIYWYSFLMYLKITIIVLYNLFNPLAPLFLTCYIIFEFLMDILIIPFRPTYILQKIFSVVHHCFAIAIVYNEFEFNYTDHFSFSLKLVHVFIGAAGFDLVGYSRIIFKNNIRLIYLSAYLRTICSILSPIHFLLMFQVNWFSYLAGFFNIFVICLIWYQKPENCFPDPLTISSF